MKVVGVTGGIAAGKSTVTRMLAEMGAETRSADEDARAVLADGSPTLSNVLSAFPEARRIDGTLDRAALAARIFDDPRARARLEEITHPAIIARMEAAIRTARENDAPGLFAYETPLLYEAGLADLFDAVIAVTATPELQAERLKAREVAAGRPPLAPEAVAARLAAQMSPEEKARRADFVVRTDVPLEETREQVRLLVAALIAPGEG
jgi:dephospho-CoA kinase